MLSPRTQAGVFEALTATIAHTPSALTLHGKSGREPRTRTPHTNPAREPSTPTGTETPHAKPATATRTDAPDLLRGPARDGA